MNSYQKLKLKYEKAQTTVDMIKNALTIVRAEPSIENEDGNLHLVEKIAIKRNKLVDDKLKIELNKWVAENIDEESVMRLLKIKKELE